MAEIVNSTDDETADYPNSP